MKVKILILAIAVLFLALPAYAVQGTATEIVFPGMVHSLAYDINDLGQVAGNGYDSSGHGHAFIWTEADGATEIGLPGIVDSYGAIINDSGQAVGGGSDLSGYYHAFLWTQADGATEIIFPGMVSSFTDYINDSGQVVGRGWDFSGHEHTFLWTEAEGATEIVLPGIVDSYVYVADINDSGQVVGYRYGLSGQNHAFFWTQAEGATEIIFPGMVDVSVTDINDLGQVAGSSSDSSGNYHAFLWTQAEGATEIIFPGMVSSFTDYINNSGQVIGHGSDSSGQNHTFLWTQAEGATEIVFPKAGFSYVAAINDLGQVVWRWMAHGYYHAFIWTQADGATEIGLPGMVSSYVAAINDSGQVVGHGSDSSGHTHAFLFLPTTDLPDEYTITATTSGSGTVTPAGTTSFLSGSYPAYTIAADAGNRIDKIVVDGVNKGPMTNYYFGNIQANHTIDAYFVPDTYTVTGSVITGAGTGTITPSGATTVNGGDSITFTVTPAAGYRINYVAVNGASIGAPTTYVLSNVRRDYAVTVSFVPITYTITVTQPANGSITPYTYTGYKAGTNATFQMYPKTGYHVETLTVDGVAQTPATSYTFTNIQADHTITATYAVNPTYTITATVTGSGTITPAGTTSFLGGSYPAYTITPAAGYRIDRVVVDGVNRGPITNYYFGSITANHTIDAYFVLDVYTVTGSVMTGTNTGTITPGGTATVNGGSSITFTIAPFPGYKINYVTVNGAAVQLVNGTYALSNIRRNTTVAAYFTPITYTITVTQPANGSISPYTFSGFTAGMNSTYNMNPKTGYYVADVVVDGTSVGAVTSYTFTDIRANHSITATYAVNLYTLIVMYSPNGTISPSSGTVEYGSSRTYTITPNAGYAIADVLVDGISVGAVSTYTLANVNKKHVISATFVLIAP